MQKLNKDFDMSQVKKTLIREKGAYPMTTRKFYSVHGWLMAISEYPISRVMSLLN